ncbi:MAG: cation:proton antiporter [Candidatus Omnitrophota bacterium]
MILLYFLMLVSVLLCLVRVALGPTAADRIMAIDILGIVIVSFCAFLTFQTGRSWYLDIAISWSLLNFIGTITLAKYLEGRGLDE